MTGDKEFRGIPKVNPGEGLSGQEFNTSNGFSKSFRGTRSEWSILEQNKILEEVVAKNVDEDKLKAIGMTKRDAARFINSEKSLSDDLETYTKLSEAGLKPDEIRARQKQVIRDRGEEGSGRIGFWTNLAGGAFGFLSDPLNATVTIAAGALAAGTSAALGVESLAGRAAVAGLENAIGDGIIATGLKTDPEVLSKGIVAGALGGAAFSVLGAGLGKLFRKSQKETLKILNESRLSKDVVAAGEKVAEKLPEGKLKTGLKEELAFYKEIGGTLKDAAEIRGKILADIETGATKQGKIVEGLKIDIPGGKAVEGRTHKELIKNLREVLSDPQSGFNREMIDGVVERLDSQEFIGNVPNYRILSEKLPLEKQKKTFIDRLDGRKQEFKAKDKYLITDTKEEAKALIKSKKIEGAQVIQQRNGKFAVVKELDTPLQLPGTARFPTKEKALTELPEYANRFGLDPEDLTVIKENSKSKNLKYDYVVSSNGSGTRFPAPDKATNTFLDRLSITRTKKLVDGVETYKTPMERSLEAAPPTSKEIDTTIDQLLNNDRIRSEIETDLKKFNGEYKSIKESLKGLKKECGI